MKLNRVLHMYGNKPPLYAFSMCVFCFVMGYNIANYGDWGTTNFIINSVMSLLGVNILDGIIKGIVKIKEDFNVSVTLN